MRASASAGAPAALAIGADRRARRPDLSVRLSRRRAGDARRARGRPRRFRRGAQGRPRTRWSCSAPGALARPDGAAVPALAAQAPRSRSAPSRTAGTASRAAHRGRAGRRPRYRLRAGRGRPQRDRDGGRGRARRPVPARRRRDRGRAGRLRGLYRHPRRPRRASRRRDPAGRRLHREIRHSTSTPRAGCRWRARAAFPPGEAREDWAILRALSDVLGHKLPYDSLGAAARGAVRRASASAAHRHDRARQPGRHREARRRSAARPTSAPFALGRRGLLPHQPDRARLRGDGRMLGASPKARRRSTAAE